MSVTQNGNSFNINVGVVPQTGQATQALKNYVKQMSLDPKTKISLNVSVNAKGAKTEIKNITDATGGLVQITKKWNEQGEFVGTTITKIKTQLGQYDRAIKSVEGTQQRLNSTVKSSKSIFSDFSDTFMKMVKFNTINLIYDGLITKMSEAIQITNDFDAAMTEFKKVTDTSNLSLSEYTETLGQYGEAVARTQTQMLEAATEFSKAGFDPKTAAQLSQIASLYQNIADDEISAGEAASFIISQMKAYNIEASNATSVLDKLNEVKLFVTS